MTDGVYILSCRLTFGPLWLGIFPFLWWFLLFLLGFFVLHGHMSFHVKPNFQNSIIYPLCVVLGFCLVLQPLWLELDKVLFVWNSVTHKKKPTIRLTIRINALSPQRSLLYWFLVLDKVKCKTHTQHQNSVDQNHLRAVNLQSKNETVSLTENCASHTFQAPCSCSKNRLAIDMLLFKTINVSID